MAYYLHDDPNLPLAWAPWFAHEYIAYFSAQAVDSLLSRPAVPVRPNPHYGDKLWPVGPKHVDIYKESYREHRTRDALWTFDYKKRNADFALDAPSGKTIEPWKVLVIYSTEPDPYPDYDLNLHRNQRITGGSHGWRHMHFKLLGTTYGIAPQAFLIHQDLARLALENGNDYWSWRYLARAGHYLADLGNPFHVKVLPAFFLAKKFFSRHELFKIVSAIHQSYEVYVERRFREGFEPFGRALLRGAKKGQEEKTDIKTELAAYIKRNAGRHNPIFYHLLNEFAGELLGAFAKLDQDSQLDAAAQTNRCSAGAARIIFREPNLAKLAFLDTITTEILADVGRMMGILFSGFSSQGK